MKVYTHINIEMIKTSYHLNEILLQFKGITSYNFNNFAFRVNTL